MYDEMESKIKVGNKLSSGFKITKGLRQGCCLSPTLFKVYINEVLKKWQEKCKPMRIKIEDDYFHSLLFADDQIVIALDEDDIKYMMRNLTETYERWGLKINFNKTKYLVAGGEGRDLDIEGKSIKLCREYKYLGVIISEVGNSQKEITSRIAQTK